MNASLKLLVSAAVLINAVVLSNAGSAAAAQGNATWSPQGGQSLFQTLGITTNYAQARSHIIIQAHKPLLIIDNTARKAVFTRRRGHLSASPPFADNAQATRFGSISPLVVPFDPNEGRQVGEMEPLIKLAENKPEVQVAPEIKPADTIQASAKQNVDIISAPPQDKWAQVLTKYTSLDPQNLVRFDYGALRASQADTARLAEYIDELAQKTPSAMGRNQAMAYWANLYNALTVQVVAQNYPVKSIRNIKSGRRKGPWKRKLVNVEGRDLTLDNIEHDILRPTYKTPLVHYMVNCASVGCPNLKTSPWQAHTLQADMEAAARDYINSSRGVAFNKTNMQASRIYRWFKKDFGNGEAGVLAHLMQYADAGLQEKLKTRTKIDKYGYDWTLNAP